MDIFELLDRFSLVIVGGLMGILAMALVWRKVPKTDPALREAKKKQKRIAKMERQIKTLRKKFDPARKHIVLLDSFDLIIIASVVLIAIIFLIISRAVKF